MTTIKSNTICCLFLLAFGPTMAPAQTPEELPTASAETAASNRSSTNTPQQPTTVLSSSSASRPETHSPAEVAGDEVEEATLTPVASGVGVRVFVDPNTGELTSQPAPGQLEELLALGRALAAQRATTESNNPGSSLAGRQPTPEEIIGHTTETFVTPVGLGARVDDRFLHALVVKIDADGTLNYSCNDTSHSHEQRSARKKGSSEEGR